MNFAPFVANVFLLHRIGVGIGIGIEGGWPPPKICSVTGRGLTPEAAKRIRRMGLASWIRFVLLLLLVIFKYFGFLCVSSTLMYRAALYSRGIYGRGMQACHGVRCCFGCGDPRSGLRQSITRITAHCSLRTDLEIGHIKHRTHKGWRRAALRG